MKEEGWQAGVAGGTLLLAGQNWHLDKIGTCPIFGDLSTKPGTNHKQMETNLNTSNLLNELNPKPPITGH